ncbi:Hemolysin activation/secretion protein [Polaromonas sp. YR568]|uniref:ShlB/FhaC/HecB family hemolysin secretion/activation protein n=1 Tax=Polaromonas sp. YR568 TaxID=1855301 RepID=UPI0008E2423D|nr:ShlB/FhaC/HecB family hemolysin secretion/activation protein [Polaromonas sp. YR568]SFU80337.1 Hemolysin activation/secretion protein [Polaromonas sp. YR568]
MAVLAGHVWAQPAPQTSAEQEQRRAQERERLLREQQEKAPDVRGAPAPAADNARLPAAESPCFPIQTLQLRAVTGEQAAVAAQFNWALDAAAGPDASDAPTGRCLGAESIAIVIKRLQNAVIARGYVTTRILAEPQDLKTGVLTLTVIPGRIRAIRFAEGSSARGNAWTAVPARPGDILNLRDIEQALENFKRVPTAEADIQIEEAKDAGAQPGQSDLVISYQQALPFRASFFADDSGSKATGKYQGGVTLSYDNWWTLNDLFYVSLNTDLGGGDAGGRGTRGSTVHYSVPIGYWALAATVSNNRYFQSVAGASQDYVYRGTSSNAEVKLSRLVYRDASRKSTVSFKAFQRRSNNFIDDTEVEVQRRIVGGWELAAGHKEFIGQATLEGNLAYKRGTGAFGSLPAPEEAFGEGTSRFAVVNADANLTVPFKIAQQGMRYSATWRLQHDRTPLTPQDRFAIGGRYTVRGFDGESSLSAERGWLLRNELSTALGATGQELYVGLDHGEVGGPSSEFLVGKRLTGAVVGLRGSFKKLQYDIFIGAPVKKPEFFRTASSTLGVSLSASF